MAEKETTKTATISSASSTAPIPGGASPAHAPSIRLFGTRITALPTVEKAEETETSGKPQAASGLTCPRCTSKETKFCYFNNYNVNQPRYYCRGCQRYWTAGGALRNVPIGAGRRKGRSPPHTEPPPFSFDGATVVQHLLFPSKRHNTGGIH